MPISRRGLLVGGGAVAALAACASQPAQPRGSDPTEPLPPLRERIEALEERHNAFVGVFASNVGAVSDAEDARAVAHRADDPFAMCSTFKAYAAACVLQKVSAGEVDLADSVSIEAADITPHSPVVETRVGATMTIGELCRAALVRSDNAAGNWLLRIIGGPSRITDFARTIGDDRTRLDRWETELNAAVPGDPRDTSTPRALGRGFRALLTGDVLGDRRQQLDDWMRANETSSMRAGLPPRWISADKTGSGDYGSTNDVGIVYGPAGQRVLLAFMTRSRSDEAGAPNLRPLIGELATLVLPYVSG